MLFFSKFLRKILNPFSPGEHSICHILGMVGPIDVKQKGNESTGCYADMGTLTFDLEFSGSNCISGMGGPIVME